MLESINTTELEFKPLTPEEKSSKGILGRLFGPIASCVKSTRNGRKYTDKLWEKAFDSPIVKEMFANGGLPGELNHPSDRSETDATKIAIMMPEPPKKNKDGHLVASVDILDTPCGKIAYQLAKYGFKFGISSRGEGDVQESWDGEEVVDPSSYTLEAFDLVLLPAVETARLRFTESFDPSRKSLKVALREALETSSEDEQRVMRNTLDELSIDYSDEENNPERVDNIEVTTEDVAAVDDGANMINELHEALQRQQELEAQVKTLQEKLSVCYTKESRYSDRLGKANSKVAAQETENNKLSEQLTCLTNENSALAEDSKKLNSTVKELTESIKSKDNEIKELRESLEGYRSRYAAMQKQLKESASNKTKLDENLSSKSARVKELTEAYTQLKESCEKRLQEADTTTKSLEARNTKLTEKLQDAKKDSQIFKSQFNAKLEKSQQLVEKYKSIAKTAVEKYISSQAAKIGASSSDIKSRLTESYSFKDIDRVVEDLQQYKINLNSLPFTTMTERKPVKAKIREAKEPLLDLKDKTSYNVDDDIDATLLTFTN